MGRPATRHTEPAAWAGVRSCNERLRPPHGTPVVTIQSRKTNTTHNLELFGFQTAQTSTRLNVNIDSESTYAESLYYSVAPLPKISMTANFHLNSFSFFH